MSNDIITYRDGIAPLPSAIKMPGLRKFENITLRRGMFSGNNDFYNWINGISQNAAERSDINISLFDEAHNVVVVWLVTNAWPCRLSYLQLKSGESHAMMEELEIAHEGWTVQNDSTTT